MKPFRLLPQGRGNDAKQHERANYRVEEFRVGDPPGNVSPLPVAGLPLRSGETHLVRRGKIRPVVVFAMPGMSVAPEFTRNTGSWQQRRTLLVAPYYGTLADGTRGGWDAEFVSRIQRAEYSQYVWDILPEGGVTGGSILRLDHLFPVGDDPANWRLTGFCLTTEALDILDEWLSWHVTGTLEKGGVLECLRHEFSKLDE